MATLLITLVTIIMTAWFVSDGQAWLERSAYNKHFED